MCRYGWNEEYVPVVRCNVDCITQVGALPVSIQVTLQRRRFSQTQSISQGKLRMRVFSDAQLQV